MDFCNVIIINLIILIFSFGYVQNRRKIKSNYLVDFKNRDSDIYLNSIQLIHKYGYRVQKHTVITDDGYLVSCYRIPNSGPPVLLAHGIGDSSDSWLVLGPTKSLAFQLADFGYDVWLYNARGNSYSKGHVKNLSPKEFWDFSYEEMGTQDLPAVIDYVLQSTSRKNLDYIGFSQGTTIFFVMCSVKPEYNEKIKSAILLAPVAWLTHTGYPFMKLFAQNYELFKSVLDAIGVYELFSNNALVKLYHAKVCQSGAPEYVLCTLEYNVSYGLKNLSNLYLERLPVVASHIPAGISTKTFAHYFQSFLSDRFQMYDYGSELNQRFYLSSRPRSFNLSLVTAPIYMYSSEIDWFSSVEDVRRLTIQLPNVVQNNKLNASLDFTHLEFVYGERVKELINEDILKILDNVT